MLNKLKEVLVGKTDEPKKVVEKAAIPKKSGITKAKTERIKIWGDHQNPMWKKGITDGGMGEGCKVWVPKRFANRLRNKVVECERVDENGETYYKYNP